MLVQPHELRLQHTHRRSVRVIRDISDNSHFSLYFIASQPSLTTDYTPLQRGALSVTPKATPQSAAVSTAAIAHAATSHEFTRLASSSDGQGRVEEGPDPSTLPPATAPPSHPKIDPSMPGTLDGRSILDVDLGAMAEKPWRRSGSDISDWFNYGFDEISWEAYCYRRRDLGELANVLKVNVMVCLIIDDTESS